MKKAILVFVAGLMVFLTALPVFAVDLKFNGDFRVRGFYTDNLTDQSDSADDETAYNSMRFLLTTTASAGIAKGVVTMDFTSTNSTGNQRFGETPSYGPQNRTFALLEAYIKADLRMATFSAGRQMFKIGHGIIFDDPADGFVLDVPLGPAKITLVNLKPFDCTNIAINAIGTGCTNGTSDDTDLYLVNGSFRPTGELAANAFVGLYKDRGPNIVSAQFATGTQGVELWFLGATADASVGPITLTGEIDYLRGDMEKNSASPTGDLQGVDIQVGGSMNVGPANVGLMGLYATGNDPASTNVNINGIDGNFPTGIILTNGGARSLAPKDGTCLGVNGAALGGIPNCINSDGLKAIKGTASISPIKRLNLEGDVIYAKSSGAQFQGGSRNIGWELDGMARYKLDDNFSLMTGIGYLITDDYWKTSATAPSPDDMIVGVMEASFHF